MVLDRSKAPAIQENIKIHIPKTHSFKLDNGIEVFEINMGTQNILKVEMVFNAGRIYESKKLAGRVTASILKEATKNYSSSDLAEKIDFYGATIMSSSNMDHASLTLICLNKYFGGMLDILIDIWTNPLFQEDELEKYRNKVKQQLKINLSKNEVLAYREFTRRIFSDKHPYGFNSTEDLYNELHRQDLINHYRSQYFRTDTKIFISGLIDDSHRQLLNKTLGAITLDSPMNEATYPQLKETTSQKIQIKGEQEYQSAIRVGKKLFNRSNKDYAPFYFMNTIFGGYFGSRLMKNIREEKAYTYGIHSYMDTLRLDGYFSISTEVGNEYLEPTLKEVFFEIEKMKNDLVSDHEYIMARNYLLGQFLNMLDGPLKVSQIMKTMIMSGKDLSFIQDMIQKIKNTNKQEIRDLAIKYLKADELMSVTVGK
jgi:predicted Zn-dependent peptidase